MLTLLLLRHAKSSWDDPSLDDFDRPLAPRGAKAASLMGAYIERHKLKPDLVLSSAAVRTRATLALVLAEWSGPAPGILYEDTLYLATPTVLLERLRRAKKEARRIMLLGHNPGLQAVALELIGKGKRKSIAEIATKFPTAALAVIEFDIDTWSGSRPAAGTLALFTTPRGASA